MSDKLGGTFLDADKVIVPYEVIAGGKQVSSFVILTGDSQTVFSLVESDKDIGPVKLKRADLSGDQLSAWLEERKNECEVITPKDIRVTEWSFRYEGTVETVIYAIELIAEDGRALRMSRDGAAYPYCLRLQEGAGAVTRHETLESTTG